jgi:serine/threonine-protein kinase RsbW
MIDKRKELSFKSAVENIHLVEKFIDDISDEYNINNTYFGNILIAVTEAVTNAIKHGNKQNPGKTVSVIFATQSRGFSFTISDEGNGFDVTKITDPTDAEHNTNPSEGRGLFLIKSLADEVNFSNNGKTIEIIFDISSINAEMTLNRINQLNAYTKSAVNKQFHR